MGRPVRSAQLVGEVRGGAILLVHSYRWQRHSPSIASVGVSSVEDDILRCMRPQQKDWSSGIREDAVALLGVCAGFSLRHGRVRG